MSLTTTARRRRAAVLAAGAALVLGLAACSQGSATTPPSSAPEPSEPAAETSDTTEPAAEDVTITYMNFSSNDGQEETLAAMVEAFEAENPGIKVAVETLPYADYFTKLQTAVAGNTEADTYELNFENFVTYASNGVLAELTGVPADVYKPAMLEAFQLDGTQYGLPASFSNVVLYYNKDLFTAGGGETPPGGRARGAGRSDGTQYGLPASFSNVVLYYNKDLFTAGGVETPSADWTWDDVRSAAEKLTDKDAGVWGMYQPVSFHEFYKVLAQAGGEFFNADKTEATFASPQGIEAATWLVEKSGTVMPTE